MDKNLHSIQKVFLEIDTPSMAMANSFKNNLAMFMQNELVPILEKQFNLIENNGNQIVQIEKLEISINSNTGKTAIFLSNSEPGNDIKNQIEKEIQKVLSELKKSTKEGENNSEVQSISLQDKNLKTLLYFIKNGTLPWWVSKGDEKTFLENSNFENIKKDVFLVSFRKLIQEKKIQKRIINQFSNPEIAFFSSVLFETEMKLKTLSENHLLQFITKKSHEFKTSFWQLIFNVANEKPMDIFLFYHQKRTEFLSEKISFELFIQSLKTFCALDISDDKFRKMHADYLDSEKEKSIIKPESSIEINHRNPINKEDNNLSSTSKIQSNSKELIANNEDRFEEEKSDSQSCYVQNAGLIILHPFLKELLKSCDLIEDNKITNKELAAHILYYAATKTENAYEHSMLFEKFLCGIPMKKSIKREINIEEKHKQQIEEMLLSVIEHWSALKNTSIDILRTEFLQREGKLDFRESNPKLTIERKTQDILLEKIPWNISIIKIPWMEKLIYTQW